MKRMSSIYIEKEGTLLKGVFLRKIKGTNDALVTLFNEGRVRVSMDKILTEEEGDLLLKYTDGEMFGVEVIEEDPDNFLNEFSTDENQYYWGYFREGIEFLTSQYPWMEDDSDEFTFIRVKDRVIQVWGGWL